MSVTHATANQVNLFLQAQPQQQAGFGVLLVLVDEDDAGGANSLNGSRTVKYLDETEVAAAQTAGYISLETKGFLDAVFAQQPKPIAVRVGKVQTGAPENETWAAGYAAVRAASSDYYAVSLTSRVDADIAGVAGAVETEGDRIFIGQSDSADLLTANLPAALSALGAYERSALVFHDDDTVPADAAWAASRLSFDPNNISAAWEGQVRGIAGYTTALTPSQAAAASANGANLLDAYSSAPIYALPGQTMTGRGVDEILSADWFRARLNERIQDLKLRYSALGQKLVVDEFGRDALVAEAETQAQLGVDAGHFVRGQVIVTGEPITVADETNRRLRVKVEMQWARNAVSTIYNVYLSQTSVA